MCVGCTLAAKQKEEEGVCQHVCMCVCGLLVRDLLHNITLCSKIHKFFHSKILKLSVSETSSAQLIKALSISFESHLNLMHVSLHHSPPLPLYPSPLHPSHSTPPTLSLHHSPLLPLYPFLLRFTALSPATVVLITPVSS